MAEITFGEAYEGAGPDGRRPVSLVHLAGGLVSLALLVGIGVWGGKIILRDVSGVPVVRAMSDGPMRIAPENPGGTVAAHAGLTVNTIAAEGETGAPEDRLVLAPPSVDLAAEDLEVAPMAEAGEVAPAAVTPAADAPLTAEEVLALADKIAADAQPFAEAPDAATDTAAATEGEADVTAAADPVFAALQEAVADGPAALVVPASVPGVARSPRPAARPAVVRGAAVAEAVPAAASAAPTIPVLTEDLPAGTKLVQLGAYDSPALAEADWTRIAARFADFLGGKAPLIQQAESGGERFYRLRAQGFDDLNDARRFCSALMAENAPCIPVVVR